MPGLYTGDASWLDTAGRLLIIAFFLIVGIRNLQRHQVEDHVQRLEAYGTAFLTPTQTFWAGAVLEFVGCALLLLNWYPAVGALCLILFTVLATALTGGPLGPGVVFGCIALINDAVHHVIRSNYQATDLMVHELYLQE